MDTVLSIHHLSKHYGPIHALKGVSFDVPKGAVFGILGPNGSGKTTLLGILLDVLKADEGSYSWLGGLPAPVARRRIGSLLETPNFYHYMSAWDNLEIAAAIKGHGREDRSRVLDIVGLSARKDSKFQTYSLGMKQRLAIGAALLGNPDVLVLDEPTNGLDPAGIAEIRGLIRQLNQAGITIIMASHLLDEVEKVCDHVAILRKGDLLVEGRVDDVMRNEDQIEVCSDDLLQLKQVLDRMPGIGKITENNGLLQIGVRDALNPTAINSYCHEHGILLSHLAVRKRSLESKFMELMER